MAEEGTSDVGTPPDGEPPAGRTVEPDERNNPGERGERAERDAGAIIARVLLLLGLILMLYAVVVVGRALG